MNQYQHNNISVQYQPDGRLPGTLAKSKFVTNGRSWSILHLRPTIAELSARGNFTKISSPAGGSFTHKDFKDCKYPVPRASQLEPDQISI